MKISATAAISVFGLGLACTTWAERAAPGAVVVSVHAGSNWGSADLALVARAKLIAAAIFSHAGVRVDWRSAGKNLPASALSVWMDDSAPRPAAANALGYAVPRDGHTIVVLYDRVKKRAEPMRAAILLAHVLVHEITHLLQGVPRHSPAGIMKAEWGETDYWNMWQRTLEFAPVDIELLHQGMNARTAAASPALALVH